MKLHDLSLILKTAAETGAANALREGGALIDKVSKSQAYRQFGRANVDRWVAEKLIVLHSADGKTLHKCIDRSQLEAVADASNRITYLPVTER